MCSHVKNLGQKLHHLFHFILLIKLVCFCQVGQNIKPQDDTPLSDMLGMNLEKHLDGLNAISAQVFIIKPCVLLNIKIYVIYVILLA